MCRALPPPLYTILPPTMCRALPPPLYTILPPTMCSALPPPLYTILPPTMCRALPPPQNMMLMMMGSADDLPEAPKEKPRFIEDLSEAEAASAVSSPHLPHHTYTSYPPFSFPLAGSALWSRKFWQHLLHECHSSMSESGARAESVPKGVSGEMWGPASEVNSNHINRAWLYTFHSSHFLIF